MYLECFSKFLLQYAVSVQGKVRYIVRPVLPSGCEKRAGACGGIGVGNPVNLGGYGVELALKNMEYKAMDDSTVKKGQHTNFALCSMSAFIIPC